MKRKPRVPTERTARRVSSRDADKLADARERLFAVDAGGSPERPLDVVSASVVEAQALGVPCPRCGGGHELDEHLARTLESGVRLREVTLKCRQCGTRRSLWFRIVADRAN